MEKDTREFVSDCMDFIITNTAHITDKFEYDIIDEYDNSTETMEMPVNYHIDQSEHKVFIISINTKGLEQQKKHRQF